MKILSTNISLPKKIIFNNKTLITSIFKEPTDKVLKVKKNGLFGDGQADLQAHGGVNKAIYLYSYLHYEYWSSILKKDFSNDYGLVGENLTIDDLNEKQFFIGDELKIANVVIKITQPRIPCYKLSIKMNVKNFTQLFIDHGYLGIYAKVIKQGQIKKGDNLELIHRENDTMSIYEVSKLVFDKNSNVEQLKKAVEIKYLSEEIKARFINKLAKLGHYEVI
jgi:MOSC domain-containing protein YiiM